MSAGVELLVDEVPVAVLGVAAAEEDGQHQAEQPQHPADGAGDHACTATRSMMLHFR